MMELRKRLAILCAKAASVIIQKFSQRSGSSFPGYLARLIAPDILPAIRKRFQGKIIVTMGTNGKTTVNSIICHALKTEGMNVLSNQTGANMLNGIVCAFLLACDRKGRITADYACIEVDEFASVQILPHLKPDCVVITNIFRDQIDRYGEIDIIFERIRTAVSSIPQAKLVGNCDDFLSYTLISKCRNEVSTYGISQQFFDAVSKPEVQESIFCYYCGQKLAYDFFHYAQLGIYHCPGCGFQRPLPDYTASDIFFGKRGYTFDINGIHLDSRASAPYNVYNTLSAYAALHTLHAPTGRFQAAVESFDYANNREGLFQVKNARIHFYLAKNPVGFQQKISLIVKDCKPKDIIVQINDTSQDGKDISWLWDVDFQYFKDANAKTITTVGTRRLDMALRLKYEDIVCRTSKNLKSLLKKLSVHGTGNIYLIVNYSGLLSTNRMLHKLQTPLLGWGKRNY